MTLDANRLLAACGDDSFEAGIAIKAELEPLGGSGAPVKPSVYAGGVYQLDRRWRGNGGERRPVDAVVIDNVPSQANRLEAALRGVREQLRLPEIILDLAQAGPLPPHLPERLSSFQFPHRQADAYLRDAMMSPDQDFVKSEVGVALFAASADAPLALLEWFPQALLFGFWQSHLGKKRSQAKLARSWVSEIVGYDPAASETRQLGLKGDPLNLSIDESVVYDENDVAEWHLSAEARQASGSKPKDKRAKKEKLSKIGHGQVPVSGTDAALAGISFAEVEQQATVSFAALRRLHLDTAEQSAAMRALLVALGLVAHVHAFGRSFSLRSGCELRAQSTSWTWLGEDSDEALEPLGREAATELFQQCVAEAERVSLPVGRSWPDDPLVVQPKEDLIKAIKSTYPVES